MTVLSTVFSGMLLLRRAPLTRIIAQSVTISVIVSFLAWFSIAPIAPTITALLFIYLTLALSQAFSSAVFLNPKVILVQWFGAIALYIVTSSPLLHHEKISSQMIPEEIQQPMFAEVQEPKQRLVPIEVAMDKQSKVINGRLDDGKMISSMYDLDKDSLIYQSVNNKKVYATPLTWSSPWKWLINDYDVIGYAISSSTDPDAPTRLVNRNPDGSKIHFKVTENGYFNANLKRHVISKLGNVIIEDSYFMLDDNEHPYYVSFLLKSYQGFGNYAPDGVAVTDPQTLEVIRYSQDKIPSFIDARSSESTLLTMFNNYGEYREGYFASWSSTIRIKATKYNNKSEMFFIDATGTENGLAYFTGVEGDSSKNKSLTAMLFIDPISLKSYIYYPGTESQNESAVIDSVKASLGNLSDKWVPTQPIPYRIFGDVDVWMTPIIPISGSSRKVEAYAYTKIMTTEKSAWDTKLSNAMSKLLTTSSDSGIITNSKSSSEPLQGSVRTIYFIDGSAYITLLNYDKIIECNHQTNVECRGIKENQKIDIHAIKKNSKEMVLVEFNENPIIAL